jgi:ribosomal protein S12 methylthiotransferase
MKRCYIENLGCAKNQVDAEVMLKALTETGDWTYTKDPQQADLILINTCGFIEPAREESLDAVFSLRALCPDTKILMTGCLAQRYGQEMNEELTEVDGFFGNNDLAVITTAAENVMDGERVICMPDYPDISEREYMHRDKLLSFAGSAYVKISEGCDHRCRYCAIPLIRGPLRSRSQQDVIDEVRELIARGVYEINLIAQDLAAFGRDRGGSEFLELLDALSLLPGDFLIRLLYIHPDDFPKELPKLIRSREKIAPYFDIPFQHASVPVLRSMGRTGSAQSYLQLIEEIRAEVPDAVIRSTFLLGFLNEDQQARDELLQFVRDARLDWAGCFIYSLEEGTPAYADRSEQEHAAAIEQAEIFKPQLEAVQQQITEEQLARWVGRELPVLIEECVEGEELLIGRIASQAPEVDGLVVVLSDHGRPGDRLLCRITRVIGVDLEAIPV